jgi:hypothetical protein
MTYNENADRCNGRRDEDSIPAHYVDCIRIAFVSACIEDVRRNPVSQLEALRNLARLSRQMGGHR